MKKETQVRWRFWKHIQQLLMVKEFILILLVIQAWAKNQKENRNNIFNYPGFLKFFIKLKKIVRKTSIKKMPKVTF